MIFKELKVKHQVYLMYPIVDKTQISSQIVDKILKTLRIVFQILLKIMVI